MHKILTIAMREYLAAVRTKAFLITLLLMPVMMGGSIVMQMLFRKLDDARPKKYAVIDRSPDRKLAGFLQLWEVAREMARTKDADQTAGFGPKVEFVVLPPSEESPETMAKQRFEVGQQIEKGEYEALVEIGSNVLALGEGGRFPNPDTTNDRDAIRFQSKGLGGMQYRQVLGAVVNQGIQQQRLGQKLTPEELLAIQTPVPMKVKSPTKFDPGTNQYTDAPDESRLVSLFLPVFLIMLMFMVIMIGATPAMHGILEEKSLRIAEVLLGSVTPFQLMCGKLLGIVGVAMTMAGIYLGGGYATALYTGYSDYLPLWLLAWLVPMLVLALLIYGSLFIAVGAAASDLKDTQTLLMPVMLVACLPFFALGPIMQEPNGTIARICTFFPFATPMMLVARQSVPPHVPMWEMVAGIALVLVTTVLCLWAAGRIFRVGILLHGKTPTLGDLIAWIRRG